MGWQALEPNKANSGFFSSNRTFCGQADAAPDVETACFVTRPLLKKQMKKWLEVLSLMDIKSF